MLSSKSASPAFPSPTPLRSTSDSSGMFVGRMPSKRRLGGSMTFFSSARRSGRGPGFAPGLVIAVCLISAFMTPQRAGSKANIQDGGGTVTTVSAASYAPVVSPNSIVAAFGSRLATRTASATAQPLPTILGGTTVSVNGALAPLFYVSPGQINYLTPLGIPPGMASVVVTSDDGVVSTGS